jgi:hypothetical protein
MHSHLVNFVRIRASILDQRLRTARAARAAGPPAPARPDRAPLGFEITSRILDAVAGACRERGVPLAVLFVPSYSEVAPEGWQAIRWPDPRPLRRGVEELKTGLAARGVPVLDPLAEVGAASRTGKLYFPLDGHLNRRGSRLMGELVAGFLVGSGLIPF